MHAAPLDLLSRLSRVPEREQAVTRAEDLLMDAEIGLVHRTEHADRGGAAVQVDATTIERAMAGGGVR